MSYDAWKTRSPDDAMEHDPEDDDPPMMCPVTGMYCDNWGEPSCEDFGCCRQAGLPPLGPDNMPLDDDM